MTITRLIHPFIPTDHLLHYGALLYVQQNSEDEDVELDSELEAMYVDSFSHKIFSIYAHI